jgi:large subunit ribosomal protein L25
MDFVQIPVVKREGVGSHRSSSLRRQGKIPAVLCGLRKPTLSLTLEEADLTKFLRAGGRLVELRLGADTRPAILREVQVDPLTDDILHVDFYRVDKDADIEDRVPLVYKGRAKGAATGGVFQAITNEVRVRCKPHLLPREIVIEVTHLELNQGIHAKDLPLAPGVTLLTPPDNLLCHVTLQKVEVVAPVTPAEGAAAPAEPELIGKKPAAEEDEEGGDEKGEKKGDAKKPEAKKPEAKKPEAKEKKDKK